VINANFFEYLKRSRAGGNFIGKIQYTEKLPLTVKASLVFIVSSSLTCLEVELLRSLGGGFGFQCLCRSDLVEG